jgi:hypothetical protein
MEYANLTTSQAQEVLTSPIVGSNAAMTPISTNGSVAISNAIVYFSLERDAPAQQGT